MRCQKKIAKILRFLPPKIFRGLFYEIGIAAYSQLVTQRTRHMWRVHFFTKSELVTVNASQRLSYSTVNSPHGDHQTVNSSQWTCHKDSHRVKWTRHTVNSSHDVLVTLEARWPSHTELISVVTKTVTTSTAPICSHVADTCLRGHGRPTTSQAYHMSISSSVLKRRQVFWNVLRSLTSLQEAAKFAKTGDYVNSCSAV